MSNYKFKINGNDYEVAINSIEGNIADVNVNGANYKVEIENAPAQPQPAAPMQVQAAAPATQAPVQTQAPAANGEETKINSPLPGVIIDVKVKVGDAVKAGQPVAVIEAMKMENDIEAETAGTVTAVHVSKGDSVLEGAHIVTLSH
ncbi:MAG: biotin/lipoyl-containing protein [Candidatus Cryptobacteroides sp.]